MTANASDLSPLQKAALAIKSLRSENDALREDRVAPVAVVGVACRLPAGSDTPEQLWEALQSGRMGSAEVPASRWDSDAYYDPEPGVPGKMYVKKSCFIDPVDQFDPLFFRISPREAIGIDPQQRLLLEVVHEALEDAGLPPPSLIGSRTGVFLGISTNDYSALLASTQHGSGSNAGAGAGNAASVASGRISYTFGLQGPCFAVDTACSSSLVTAHLAVRALRNKECETALVAGVNLMLTPDITINFCQGRMLSPDGLCKTFDQGADGYVRGEGCGVLVLKRLDDALAAGDRVLAVIQGSAINQDGRSAGLTAPNGKAQVSVIRDALRDARLEPAAIDFIEAHGTGTSLGDPIEMHALRTVFEGRDRPLGVGSVKTNIGHTEAAAGVSGLLKAVLMLRNKAVPPHPSFRALNDHIELGDLAVEIPTAHTKKDLRHIGVSSFGFSGTNAHVILSSPPEPAPVTPTEANTAPQLLITAQSEAALKELIADYTHFFETDAPDFADVCHSAQVERGRYKWWAMADSPATLARAEVSNTAPPKIPAQGGRRIKLPKTPFERKRYWIEGAEPPAAKPTVHPLLGTRTSAADGPSECFEKRISAQDPALKYLFEHVVDGAPIAPGAAFLELARAARPGHDLANVTFRAPLNLSQTSEVTLQVTIGADAHFEISSTAANAPDTLHVTGQYASPRAPHPLQIQQPTNGPRTNPETYYANLKAHGVAYGCDYQRLSEIVSGKDQASASLAPLIDNQYVVHPVVLDAAMQAVAAACAESGLGTMVPAGVERVALTRAPTGTARVDVQVKPGAGSLTADVCVQDAQGTAFGLYGLRFLSLATGDNHGFHRVEMRPMPRTFSAQPGLPDAAALAQSITEKSHDLAAQHDLQQYRAAEAGLDSAAYAFAVKALRDLGFDFAPGQSGSVAALAGNLGVEDRHKRLFTRLIGFLVEDGVLALSGRRWTVLKAPEDALPNTDALAAQHPALAAEIEVMSRCGTKLADVLIGKADPLTLIFSADGSGADSFYSDSPYAKTVNGLLEHTILRLIEGSDKESPLRIVEIGAGTGASTRPVLAALRSHPFTYTFTDLSAAFLSAATRDFGTIPLETKRLDIEQDPIAQGFTAGCADVVIAANVLHATADIRQSLRHASRLLANGGTLMLVESMAARRWVDIVFGLTEGWWRFTDTDLRRTHPLLSSEAWARVLREEGFEPGIAETNDVLVARKQPAFDADLAITGAGPALKAQFASVPGLRLSDPEEAPHVLHVVPDAPPTLDGQTELFVGLCAEVASLAERDDPPRLTLLAQPGLAHGGLPGFVRSLRLEHPELAARLILSQDVTNAVLDAVLTGGSEEEVTFAQGAPHVPRLIPAQTPPSSKIHGTWLITGGAGGLGTAIAAYLAQSGAEQLILIGRNTPTDLPDFGVPTSFVEGDAADADFLKQTLAMSGPISGVVHAAGLLANAPIISQTAPTADRVFRAKIGGALALDQATRGLDLDHFILFSTAAGVLGAAHQANHAYAGTFLDGIAESRRAQGLPGLSMDWSVWREIGSAARLGFDAHAEELGLGSINTGTGTAAFGAALAAPDSSLVILPGVDFETFSSHIEDAPRLFDDVFPARTVPQPPPIEPSAPPQSTRPQDMHAALSQLVAEILHVDGAIDPAAPLYEYGLDSLVAVEIKNRAAKEHGLDIQVRDLIEGASISDVAGPASAPRPAPVPDQPDQRETLYAIIADLLGLNDPMDPNLPLYEYGLDSLVAVEIKNRVERDMGLTLQVRDMIEGASAAKLAEAFGPIIPSVPSAPHAPREQRQITPDVANAHAPFALTDIQLAYWLGSREDVALGNVGCYLYTEFDTDQVDIARLQEAWNCLIARHGMLRAVISHDGTQRILEEVPPYVFEALDLDSRPGDEVTAALDGRRATLSRRRTPAGHWPLFDIQTTRHNGLTRIHMGFDLIALDAASIFALRQEWAALYDDLALALPPIGLSFRDVVLEEAHYRQSAAFKRSEAYWLDRADTLPAHPDLPVLENTPGATPRFCRRRIVLDRETAARLKADCGRRSLTLSSVLAAAYADILAIWSRDPQFCITVSSFNRPDIHPDIGSLVGDFTSTLLLEVDARADRFKDRALRLARRMAQDLDHGDVSGVHVLREIAKKTGGAVRNSPIVFTSTLGFTAPTGPDQSDSAGWDRLGKTVYNVSSTPQIWIDHQISEEDGQLFCNWDVLEGTFPEGVVDEMVAAHDRLLHALANGDGWDWSLRAAAARPARAPALPLPEQGLLHQGFLDQAQAEPGRVAIDSPDRTLTYGELHAEAARLATRIVAHCGGHEATRDRLIAICLEKGWQQIVAVMGTLMAGAAYLPLDPAWPEGRRQQVLAHSDAHLLDPAWIDGPQDGGPPDLKPVMGPDRLAYVIYTSGSTGTPKGVMITHSAALTTVEAVNRTWQVGANDRVLALSALSFDLSVYDIFGLLSVGGAIVMPSAGSRPDPASWAKDLTTRGVTIWNTAPALMALMTEHRLPADQPLRLIMLSGDWVALDTVQKLKTQAPEATLVALGGATEAAIWSNYHVIDGLDAEWRSVPYGTPLDGHNLHVVARDHSDLPDWTLGNIEISGAGLAKGYLGDPARTAERFRTDPRTGERRYVTGDVGRFRPFAGSRVSPIEFLGREDFQVKVQGHRIELGEIEHVLEAHPAVLRAVAHVMPAGQRDPILAGFVLPASSDAATLPFDMLVGQARDIAAQNAWAFDAAAFDTNATFLTQQTGLAFSRAVQQLTGGTVVTDPAALIRDFGVEARYRPLLERTLPLIENAPTAYGDAQPPSIRDLPDQSMFGFSSAQLDMLDNVITQLPDILTGRMPSGEMYLSAETPEVYDTLFAGPNQILAAVLKAAQTGTPLRVLEIGAGLGTTFKALADALGASLGTNVSYTYSDISPALLSLAQRRFGTLPGVRFETLDMTQPPGPSEAPYDIVVASNTLHVAPDLRQALGATLARLKSGGVLMLFEPTAFLPWYDLNMGLQSGFDDRKDHDLRPDHPLLSREGWQGVLSDAGFVPRLVTDTSQTLDNRLGYDVFLAQCPMAQSADPTRLQAYLAERLPSYMVPTRIAMIDALPLSANGKVDRAALKLPDAPSEVLTNGGTGLSDQIAALASDCLGTPITDPDQSFFELGANSLSLVALQRRIGERLGRAVPMQSLFEGPTVANLTHALQSGQATTSPMVRFTPQNTDGTRPDLIMMPGIFALPFFLKGLAAYLDPDISLVSCQLPGLLPTETPLGSVEAQADYVLTHLRQSQPSGPYHLAGYSYGGTVAYEVARKLRLMGEDVPTLILLDTVRTRTTLDAFQEDEIAYTAMVKGLLSLYGAAAGLDETLLEGQSARAAYDALTQRLADDGVLGPVDLLADRMAEIFKANFRALGQFVPKPLPGDLTILRAEKGFPAEFSEYESDISLQDPALGWSETVEGEVRVQSIPGDHLSLLSDESLQGTVQILRGLMGQSPVDATPPNAFDNASAT